MAARLYYVHDPMCSWCWGFRPVWQAVESSLPAHVQVRYLLGGLAPDNEQPMPPELQRRIQQHWRAVQRRIPGTRFNFDFWRVCQPRRSTYPACRAVIAARLIDGGAEKPMLEAIQTAYYLQARNPSDESVLCALANDIGLDAGKFQETMRDSGTQGILQQEISVSQQIGVHAFPGLVLQTEHKIEQIALHYHDAEAMLWQINHGAQIL